MLLPRLIHASNSPRKLTDSHDDHEARHETAKIHNRATVPIRAPEEVIRPGAFPADKVGQRCQHVCRDHDEWQIVVEESGGKDAKKKADC